MTDLLKIVLIVADPEVFHLVMSFLLLAYPVGVELAVLKLVVDHQIGVLST